MGRSGDVFWSWVHSPTLRASLAPSVVTPGAAEPCSHWRWVQGKACCSPALLPDMWPCARKAWPVSGVEEHGWRSHAFLWSTCSSASRQPECKHCQDASPALPWPLAVFGASSSNWRRKHTKERSVLCCFAKREIKWSQR